jgi:porin
LTENSRSAAGAIFVTFTDERLTSSSVSLAGLGGSGTPANLSGNYGIYSVIEQKLYRVGNDDNRGVGIYGRLSSSPSDRNLIDLYADGGLEFIGLSDARPNDKFGVASAYARVSSRARALDIDYQQLYGPKWPSRTFEGLITSVYQYEVRAGWTLQPNFQYIVHPGGGATNPLGNMPGHALKNASVFGLRTVLKF